MVASPFVSAVRHVISVPEHDAGSKGHVFRPVPAFLMVAGLTALATLVVYFAGGGTQLPWVHLLYIPILFGAMATGVVGGFAAALLAGIAVGPWMPLDVASGEAQEAASWIARLTFFVLIGTVAGIMFGRLAAQKAALRLAALRDPLTELPNRVQMIGDLAEQLDGRGNAPATLLAIEQCRYDDIREIFGVRYSDRLLVATAERLRSALPPGTQLYHMRLGRFAALLGATDFATTFADVTALPDSMDGPLDVEGIAVDTDVRVGVVRIEKPFVEPSDLLRRGAAALRKARNTGSRIAIYDLDEDNSSRHDWDLLTDMKLVLDAGTGLELFYQPKIDFADGHCRSVEALVRWNHKTKDYIPPAEFIPALEKTALIVPFTHWVLDESLRSLAAQELGDDSMVVSINVSVRNLEERSFAGNLRERLAYYGVAPERLEIEVTESAIIREPEVTRAALAAVRDAGVSVALDDYGTGYSSLSCLHEMPLTTVKLDRQFIIALLKNTKSAIIAQSTIDVAHKLGLTVVAEGVEDAVTASVLREMGCDIGQGYLWSPALPLPAFREWRAALAAEQRALVAVTG